MTAGEESVKPKITVIAKDDVRQMVVCLLKDRDKLHSLVAIGRNDKGEIYFYDTGGDIIEDLGSLEYVREHLLRRNGGY